MVGRTTLNLVTDSAGAASQSTRIINGRLIAIRYEKTDFADGIDFSVVTAVTGQTLWTGTNVNAAVTVVPRQATEDNVGAASLYAAAGEAVEDYYRIAEEAVTVTIAAGGDTKSGDVTIIWED